MADLLTDAHRHAQTARAVGHDHLDPQLLTDLHRRYRGAVATGISDSRDRAGPLTPRRADPGPALPDHETMILQIRD